jgi:hypothetical protein
MDSHPDTPTWTAARLAAVAPTWEPDPLRARASRRAAPASRPRRALYATAAATAALVVLGLTPSARALAQDLWYRFFVTRVAVVRLDLSRVPLNTGIRTDGQQQTASSVADAAGKAGFTPYLPPSELGGGAPTFSVVGRIDVMQTIETKALEAALLREGATDVEVPAAWNGTTLRAVIGPMVVASYPGEVEVLQAPPIRLEMPAGFPLERFAEVAFRAGGVPWAEARQLAEEYAAQPAWLLDVPADEPVVVEKVALPHGDGLLIEDPNESGGERVTVIVSRPTRLYSVSSPSRDQSLRIAKTLP